MSLYLVFTGELPGYAVAKGLKPPTQGLRSVGTGGGASRGGGDIITSTELPTVYGEDVDTVTLAEVFRTCARWFFSTQDGRKAQFVCNPSSSGVHLVNAKAKEIDFELTDVMSFKTSVPDEMFGEGLTLNYEWKSPAEINFTGQPRLENAFELITADEEQYKYGFILVTEKQMLSMYNQNLIIDAIKTQDQAYWYFFGPSKNAAEEFWALPEKTGKEAAEYVFGTDQPLFELQRRVVSIAVDESDPTLPSQLVGAGTTDFVSGSGNSKTFQYADKACNTSLLPCIGDNVQTIWFKFDISNAKFSTRCTHEKECPCCYEEGEELVVGLCGHSVCATCAAQITKGEKFTCPLCRTKTTAKFLHKFQVPESPAVSESPVVSESIVLSDSPIATSEPDSVGVGGAGSAWRKRKPGFVFQGESFADACLRRAREDNPFGIDAQMRAARAARAQAEQDRPQPPRTSVENPLVLD